LGIDGATASQSGHQVRIFPGLAEATMQSRGFKAARGGKGVRQFKGLRLNLLAGRDVD
jgi:hypothetical protein